ncbi:hypothetical protein TVVG_00030 [Tetraselmis viridis virus SI1]|uniref:hypothetical protein n=1 Tax=Tetraselmis viridis virus S20 TaxID=754070 RepID=UPI0002C078A3|nr:hypothetical protein TVGG_00051 [Tetraselmis viridis virus S20]AGH31379.1 hypothetical protein TVGG_00051 [Tetraselmis viridis virus S20]AGH31413.1 hypothetical protein TVVG_00030 [Tetraselmis viridis virus SI1]
MTKPMNRGEFLAAQAASANVPQSGRYARKDGGPSVADVAKEVKSLSENLTKREQAMAETVKKLEEEIKLKGGMSSDTKEALEKQAEQATAIQAQLTEVQQKMDGLKLERASPHTPSAGKQFIDDDKVKQFLDPSTRSGSKVRLGIKDITSLTSGAGGAGDLVVEQRVPGIITPPDRTLTIRALLSQGVTSSNSIEFVQETGFTNNAAPTPEGTTKPQSDLTFELTRSPVVTIAHFIDATVQILDDAPMLMSYIDTRLRYGLELVEENQLLNGDGTGANLLGLIPQATDFDDSRVNPDTTRIDVVRMAITQSRVAEYRPTAVVMHPEDWESIELTKTTEGAYVWANPRGLAGPTLWGLPVIDSTAMDPGEFLLGAFMMGAQVWDRQSSTVEVSTETGNNFKENMVTIRAEERLALTVYRPEAFVTGDFSTIVTG